MRKKSLLSLFENSFFFKNLDPPNIEIKKSWTKIFRACCLNGNNEWKPGCRNLGSPLEKFFFQVFDLDWKYVMKITLTEFQAKNRFKILNLEAYYFNNIVKKRKKKSSWKISFALLHFFEKHKVNLLRKKDSQEKKIKDLTVMGDGILEEDEEE